MRTFEVTLPIAGHAFLTVEAETEEEAIEQAFNEVVLGDIEEWEALRRFNRGNICNCPTPWEAEAIDVTCPEAATPSDTPA